MIQANHLIFPHPKHHHDNDRGLKHVQHNLIFIPKDADTPHGCLCQTLTMPSCSHTSTLTTARTQNMETPTQIIQIQSSRQMRMKIAEPKHRRTQTRLINLIAPNYSSRPQPSPRSDLHLQENKSPENRQILIKKIKHSVHKHSSKFLSDDLYREQPSEEFQKEEKIQTVRVSKNRKSIDNSLNAQLWNYHKTIAISSAIPCLYYQGSQHSNKLLLYFHGNGEDITGCYNFLRNLCFHLNMSVLAVEYPGYSVYEGVASSQKIQKDAVDVVSFLCDRIGFDIRNIMVIGRSIGSGPAVHVASMFNVGGLVLLSPFLSLCEVVSDLYGRIASNLLKQRFNNKQKAKQVISPCLIVHGNKDRLISQKHTTQLSQYFQGFCMTKIVKNMSHSLFNHEQFFSYVRDFQKAIQFID